MNILIIKHAAFEKPGCIETWAKKHGHQTQEVNPYKGEKLPDIKDFDFLVVLGGPQSPLKIDESPYLVDEIRLIKQAVLGKIRILGVCLGAQLIGEALGAKTERSPNREIGEYPIELLEAAKYDLIFQQFPEKFDVMHWHNDMPGIPEGGMLLARSEGCPRQAFSYGDRIYGFQCHFELTEELVREMIENCSGDLKPGTYVMTEEELSKIDYTEINLKMEKVLDYLGDLAN